jgi:phosphoribosylformylglycinamidine cyclo-ligase
MAKDLTYAEAGVDRSLRAISKAGLVNLDKLHRYARYGKPIRLPYGKIVPNRDGNYLDGIIEGVGTKVLVAQLADKYNTIGIDAVAMATNDIIRQGSHLLFILDNIDAQRSDPYLVNEWMKGVAEGAKRSGTLILNGETADVKDVIKGMKRNIGYHMVVAAIGEVYPKDIIWGKGIELGDVVIGAESSGAHSNGISLLRKTFFKKWGGYYSNPFVKLNELEKELVYEVLEPTRIYVKPVLEANKKCDIKAAVHVTGDSHAKFDKLLKYNPKIGFTFNDIRPKPIFPAAQATARKLGRRITDKEMLKTFTMGDGFDLVVPKSDADDVIDIFEKNKIPAWQVGYVNDNGRIVANYHGQKILLDE